MTTTPNPEAQHAAASRMAQMIVAHLQSIPPVMAVAIEYQLAQSEPAIYLAYEDVDHRMRELREYASTEKRAASEARYGRNPEHEAVTGRLKEQIGLILNTGYWAHPADVAFHVRDGETNAYDPVIATWAYPAFQSYVDSLTGDDPARSSLLAQHIRDTFWMAIDEARRTSTNIVWPAFSFVHNSDDESDELLQVITLRAPVRH
jgi:hypothetical protein